VAITFVGSATAVGGATATTITLPTVLQDDIVLTISTRASGGNTVGGVPTTGGYSLVSSSGTNAVLVVYGKQMSASPDTSVTINGTGVSTVPVSHIVMAFRGVSPLFFDVSSVTQNGTGNNPNPAAITPTTNNTCIVVGAGNRANDSTPGDITNYTTVSVAGLAASGTASTTTAAAYRIMSGGAGIPEDPGAWGTWSSNVISNWTALTMALRAGTEAGVHAVDQATITLTGQSVTQVEVVPVTAGTLTFAGDEVDLAGGDRITISNGDVTWAGQTVTVTNQQFEIIPKYVVRSTEPRYTHGRGSHISLRG